MQMNSVVGAGAWNDAKVAYFFINNLILKSLWNRLDHISNV